MLLHETTRKRICRTTFLVGCVMPTLGILLAIGYYYRPWYKAAEQQVLSGKLHAAVSFDSRCIPLPGVTEYRLLLLRDLLTGVPVLSIDRIRVAQHGNKLVLSADQIEIPASDLSPLVRLAKTHMGGSVPVPVDLSARQVVLHPQASGEHKPSIEPLILLKLHLDGPRKTLAARMGQTDRPAEKSGPKLERSDPPDLEKRIGRSGQSSDWLGYRIAANISTDGKSPSCRLLVERAIEAGQPIIRATLDTQSTSLPGWILQQAIPGDRIFREGRFAGNMRVESDMVLAGGSLRGRLSQLDLHTILPEGSPHKLAGQATIDLDYLKWQDGRVEGAQGSMQASEGTVSGSLLTGACQLLHCQPWGEELEKETVPFGRFACRFQLQMAGLTVWGTCPAEKNVPVGCLITHQDKGLLLQPKYIELPMAQYVHWIAGSANAWLPATRVAERIARTLPLPTAPKPR